MIKFFKGLFGVGLAIVEAGIVSAARWFAGMVCFTICFTICTCLILFLVDFYVN